MGWAAPAQLGVGPGGVATALGGWSIVGGELPRAQGGDLLGALVDAVRRAGPCTCALSGGLDSALLLAIAAREGLADGAVTLVDAACDAAELGWARAVASASGVALREIAVDAAELPDAFEAAVLATGHLIWDPRGVAKHLLWLRSGARRALSGVGADEVLMGQPAAVGVVGGVPGFAAWGVEERTIGRALLVDGAPEPEHLPQVSDSPGARELLLRGVLPSATLPVEVASARSAGVDVRLPYLDPEFVAVALGLPARELIRGAFGKVPLRAAAAGLVPDALRWLPKTPRLSPPGDALVGRWLDALAPHLAPERIERLGVVDPERVRALLQGPGRMRVLMKVASLSILAAR